MNIFTTEHLARISAKNPWKTVCIWLILIVGSGYLIMNYLGSALTNDISFSKDLESKQAHDILASAFNIPDTWTETILITSTTKTVDDPEFKSTVENIYSKVTALKEHVASGVNYYLAQTPALVSADKRMTIIPLTMVGGQKEADENVKAVRAVLGSNTPDGFTVGMAGMGSINADTNRTAEEAFQKAEMFGIPLALVVMIIVFGAVVAAIIPLVISITAIILALGITGLVGQQVDLTFYIVNMILMMGLAVGIDYALFIVSRYREERWHGREKIEAIVKTGATAAHAVFFSGLVVLIALAGLLIVPMSLFTSLASGAIFVVAISILAILTLLPAILSILGDKVNAWKIPFVKRESMGEDRRGGFWDKVSSGVMRRPVASIILTAGLMILLLIPAFDIKTGAAGIDSIPNTLPSIKAYQTMIANFNFGVSPPLDIVIRGQASSTATKTSLALLTEQLAKQPKVYGTPGQYQTSKDGTVGLLTVPIFKDANTQEATKDVKVLRSEIIPAAFKGSNAEVLVGGAAAANLDYFELTDQYRPIVFTFVLALSFLLLTVVFRSLVVPIKAILMNLLSVGATYGLLVLVFQNGYGANLFGFSQVEAIDAWVPLFLFAVLFGLSMDYHVFLLSRIRERFVATNDNTESVAFGLRNTGKIITGAALIMVAVFAGFAAGDLVMFQQMGFGLGVAVLIDATIIRTILVPASMKLLGRWNWYLPKWLQWLPKIHVEG